MDVVIGALAVTRRLGCARERDARVAAPAAVDAPEECRELIAVVIRRACGGRARGAGREAARRQTGMPRRRTPLRGGARQPDRGQQDAAETDGGMPAW